MRILLVPAMSFALLMAPLLPAMASNDNKGRGHGRAHHAEMEHKEHGKERFYPIERRKEVLFSSLERELISAWFGTGKHSSYNYSSLPPGLAKQIKERGTLPPGLAKHGLPPGLAKKLGPAPKGYERIVVGRDVVLADILTGAVVDIIREVIRN